MPQTELLKAPPPLIAAIREQILISVGNMGVVEQCDMIEDVLKVWTNIREPEPAHGLAYAVLESMIEDGSLREHRNYQGWNGDDRVSIPKPKAAQLVEDRQMRLPMDLSTKE